MNVLALDIGGTHVKILASGEGERREFESGPKLTPQSILHPIQNARFTNKDTMKGAAA